MSRDYLFVNRVCKTGAPLSSALIIKEIRTANISWVHEIYSLHYRTMAGILFEDVTCNGHLFVIISFKINSIY